MTISEQIEKLYREYDPSGNIPYDDTPDGIKNARALSEAMSIIRALTATPAPEQLEKIGEELKQACMAEFGSTWSNDVTWKFVSTVITAWQREVGR